jgi:hypothetical protein
MTIPIHVRILKQPEAINDAPCPEGTTRKQVEFEILRTDVGWLFHHVITYEGIQFDRRIEKLHAHGGANLNVENYGGNDASPEWKDRVVRDALDKADGIK